MQRIETTKCLQWRLTGVLLAGLLFGGGGCKTGESWAPTFPKWGQSNLVFGSGRKPEKKIEPPALAFQPTEMNGSGAASTDSSSLAASAPAMALPSGRDDSTAGPGMGTPAAPGNANPSGPSANGLARSPYQMDEASNVAPNASLPSPGAVASARNSAFGLPGAADASAVQRAGAPLGQSGGVSGVGYQASEGSVTGLGAMNQSVVNSPLLPRGGDASDPGMIREIPGGRLGNPLGGLPALPSGGTSNGTGMASSATPALPPPPAAGPSGMTPPGGFNAMAPVVGLGTSTPSLGAAGNGLAGRAAPGLSSPGLSSPGLSSSGLSAAPPMGGRPNSGSLPPLGSGLGGVSSGGLASTGIAPQPQGNLSGTSAGVLTGGASEGGRLLPPPAAGSANGLTLSAVPQPERSRSTAEPRPYPQTQHGRYPGLPEFPAAPAGGMPAGLEGRVSPAAAYEPVSAGLPAGPNGGTGLPNASSLGSPSLGSPSLGSPSLGSPSPSIGGMAPSLPTLPTAPAAAGLPEAPGFSAPATAPPFPGSGLPAPGLPSPPAGMRPPTGLPSGPAPSNQLPPPAAGGGSNGLPAFPQTTSQYRPTLDPFRPTGALQASQAGTQAALADSGLAHRSGAPQVICDGDQCMIQ